MQIFFSDVYNLLWRQIKAMPTFHLYKVDFWWQFFRLLRGMAYLKPNYSYSQAGSVVLSFSGADLEKLRAGIAQHGGEQGSTLAFNRSRM